MLGASLAITKDHPPINSMKEVLESDYDIITMGGTNYETYFTKAEHDSYLYSISKKKLILESFTILTFYRLNLDFIIIPKRVMFRLKGIVYIIHCAFLVADL